VHNTTGSLISSNEIGHLKKDGTTAAAVASSSSSSSAAATLLWIFSSLMIWFQNSLSFLQTSSPATILLLQQLLSKVSTKDKFPKRISKILLTIQNRYKSTHIVNHKTNQQDWVPNKHKARLKNSWSAQTKRASSCWSISHKWRTSVTAAAAHYNTKVWQNWVCCKI